MRDPEIAKSIVVDGIKTNYHDVGDGRPVLLIHGSGPGVTAWANWRLNIPALSEKFRVIAPDMIGFGYTERPADGVYNMQRWREHLIGFADALELDDFDIVGNSFGGALALSMAASHPDRIRRMVLMGAVGVDFPLTEGLERVWGYEPTLGAMKVLLDLFTFNRGIATDELAKLRYQASVRPGFHESFSAMFPAPRQQWIDAMATPEEKIQGIEQKTLIIHGREDQVIPVENSLRLFSLIPHTELHLFGECGHWTQIEHKSRFNMLVTEFLSTD